MKGGAWRRFEIRATFGKLRPWQRLGVKVGALFVAVTALAVGVVVLVLYLHQEEEIEGTVGVLLESVAASLAFRASSAIDPDERDAVAGNERIRVVLQSVPSAVPLGVHAYVLADFDPAAATAVRRTADRPGGSPARPVDPEIVRPLIAVLQGAAAAHTAPRARGGREWITALAPLRDRDGRVAGALAVDFDVHAYMRQRERLINAVLGVALAGALVALIAGILLARRITRPIGALTDAARRVTGGDLSPALRARSADELGQLTRAFNAMLGGLRQRDLIRDAFGRYVSPEVARALLEAPDGLRLGGSKREITVVMADLRGYTGFAAGADAGAVMGILNEYLAAMADAVLLHGGIVNEFLGDAVFAIFGAPVADAHHAQHAAAAALAMRKAVEDINARHAARGLPRLEIGIGASTGEAVVGNIGSEQRAKYAAVGSVVNLAARLEDTAAAGQILMSAETYARIREAADARPLRLELKGFGEPCAAYELRSLSGHS